MNACQPTYVLYFLNLALHLPLMLPACHLHNFSPPPPLTLSSSNSPRALSTSLATNSQQALALSDAGKDFEQINSVDLFVEVVLVFGVVYYYVLQVVYIYMYVPCTLRQLANTLKIYCVVKFAVHFRLAVVTDPGIRNARNPQENVWLARPSLEQNGDG